MMSLARDALSVLACLAVCSLHSHYQVQCCEGGLLIALCKRMDLGEGDLGEPIILGCNLCTEVCWRSPCKFG